ncbi:MAG: nickel pincer cofactor biosynthesis protein LarB [Planctomycetales bacterium]|nr:nickel pincer cofactor biosynthesis protein LarB [Planctomycetales bacterium]
MSYGPGPLSETLKTPTESDPFDMVSLDIQLLLAQAQDGKISWHELAEQILMQDQVAGEHRPDVDRARRCGFGEVIYGSGKSPAAVIEIVQRLLQQGQQEVLVTRVPRADADLIVRKFEFSKYDVRGQTLRLARVPIREPSTESVGGPPALPRVEIAVVTAGSTDISVAAEALETLAWMGFSAHLITDVGVAGPYRLLAHLGTLRRCAAIVVVAGMEGALASVVGGLVACPIVAVPTSVGYGANLAGVTTLLSMVSSCAAGVTVVNIDAGFKGGYVAGLIAHQCAKYGQPAEH